jgi:putative spermidine/putrescine transport system substrate-binding protein
MRSRSCTFRGTVGAVGVLMFAAGLTLEAKRAGAEETAANLKGSGEVVITTLGGTWEDAQRKAFFEPFERNTGIKVVLVPENHAKLLASVQIGVAEADITSISAGMLASFDSKGALSEIDYGLFSEETLVNIAEPLKHPKGVGALLYSIAVAFNTDKFPEGGPQPQNWVDFYDVEKFPGPRGLAKCEKIIDGGLLEGALMSAGVAPDKVYPIDMELAFAQVEAIKPHVARWWVSGSEAPQGLVDGELDLSSAYNGRIYTARNQGAPVAMSWDQSLLQYDYWIVMSNSPNKENAMKFLAYISQAEPQAMFAEAITYGPINKKAFDLIDPALHPILPGSPEIADRQLFQDYNWWSETNAEGKTNWDVALERCVQALSR